MYLLVSFTVYLRIMLTCQVTRLLINVITMCPSSFGQKELTLTVSNSNLFVYYFESVLQLNLSFIKTVLAVCSLFLL